MGNTHTSITLAASLAAVSLADGGLQSGIQLTPESLSGHHFQFVKCIAEATQQAETKLPGLNEFDFFNTGDDNNNLLEYDRTYKQQHGHRFVIQSEVENRIGGKCTGNMYSDECWRNIKSNLHDWYDEYFVFLRLLQRVCVELEKLEIFTDQDKQTNDDLAAKQLDSKHIPFKKFHNLFCVKQGESLMKVVMKFFPYYASMCRDGAIFGIVCQMKKAAYFGMEHYTFKGLEDEQGDTLVKDDAGEWRRIYRPLYDAACKLNKDGILERWTSFDHELLIKFGVPFSHARNIRALWQVMTWYSNKGCAAETASLHLSDAFIVTKWLKQIRDIVENQNWTEFDHQMKNNPPNTVDKELSDNVTEQLHNTTKEKLLHIIDSFIDNIETGLMKENREKLQYLDSKMMEIRSIWDDYTKHYSDEDICKADFLSQLPQKCKLANDDLEATNGVAWMFSTVGSTDKLCICNGNQNGWFAVGDVQEFEKLSEKYDEEE